MKSKHSYTIWFKISQTARISSLKISTCMHAHRKDAVKAQDKDFIPEPY